MHDGIIYPIEDIASYHIHAGDYYRKERPSGAHSNYGGNQLNYFNPQIQSHGPLGVQDAMLFNSRNRNLKKPSSLYPESWSEFVCDLNAIKVMMSDTAEFSVDLSKGIINITGYASQGIKIQIGYDIKTKRIKTHFSKFN
jgi:hypothetical protein